MASKPNYKMLTFQKIIDEIGVSKDKDIFNLQIEDLCKIKNFQRVDLENIIEMRKVIKTDGIIGYLREEQTNKRKEDSNAK